MNPESNARTSPEGIGFLKLPWQLIKRGTEPEAIFILEKRNFKVYTNTGETSYLTKRFVNILDTRAASSFIKTAELAHRLRGMIQPHNDDFNVWNASGNSVPVRGSLNLAVKKGTSTKIARF